MANKLSDRPQAMIDQNGERIAPVKVRLRADLRGQKLKNAVRKIESRIDGAEYLSISGTVHGQIPLKAVASVSALPEVEWIDVEKEVPIEELIDPM
ncbi:MAG: hypothetical protein L0Z62_18485 [Gemmataceae bacterium]|nr:hypothetical protein [Gemmataceae bacterium]